MGGVIELSVWQVMLAYLFVVIVLMIVKIRGIKREKEILISSVRMTLQLILTGYLLVYVLKNPSPLITVVIVLMMEAFAVYTIFKKNKGRLSATLKKAIVISITTGTLTCLIYYLFVVIRISPWYDPQYFVPIAGMIIGNSMTGVSLGLKSLLEGMSVQKPIIEEALILGATPKAATRNIINNSFEIAIMPTINSMVGMGIVFLPGMMTGQILSGVSPTTAISYQIAIMLGILGSVAFAVIMMLQLGYRAFFNSEAQII